MPVTLVMMMMMMIYAGNEDVCDDNDADSLRKIDAHDDEDDDKDC